jgi:hypothetical protein
MFFEFVKLKLCNIETMSELVQISTTLMVASVEVASVEDWNVCTNRGSVRTICGFCTQFASPQGRTLGIECPSNNGYPADSFKSEPIAGLS